MALTPEEDEYRIKHGLKRLTFDGVNDLYQSLVWGADTIRRFIEKDAHKTEWLKKQNALNAELAKHKPIQISDEMEIQNERCIDTYGCSQH